MEGKLRREELSAWPRQAGAACADCFPGEKNQMNLECKLSPISGKVLAGLNVSLPSVSKFPKLSLSPQGAGRAKTSTCLSKSSPSYLGMAYMGNRDSSCSAFPEVPQRQQAPGSGDQSPHATLFLAQEFPLSPQIFGPSHGLQLHGAGALARAVSKAASRRSPPACLL